MRLQSSNSRSSWNCVLPERFLDFGIIIRENLELLGRLRPSDFLGLLDLLDLSEPLEVLSAYRDRIHSLTIVGKA